MKNSKNMNLRKVHKMVHFISFLKYYNEVAINRTYILGISSIDNSKTVWHMFNKPTQKVET